MARVVLLPGGNSYEVEGKKVSDLLAELDLNLSEVLVIDRINNQLLNEEDVITGDGLIEIRKVVSGG